MNQAVVSEVFYLMPLTGTQSDTLRQWMLEGPTIPGGYAEPHAAEDIFRRFMTLFDSHETHHSRRVG